jgi:hypothetical protein
LSETSAAAPVDKPVVEGEAAACRNSVGALAIHRQTLAEGKIHGLLELYVLEEGLRDQEGLVAEWRDLSYHQGKLSVSLTAVYPL